MSFVTFSDWRSTKRISTILDIQRDMDCLTLLARKSEDFGSLPCGVIIHVVMGSKSPTISGPNVSEVQINIQWKIKEYKTYGLISASTPPLAPAAQRVIQLSEMTNVSGDASGSTAAKAKPHATLCFKKITNGTRGASRL